MKIVYSFICLAFLCAFPSAQATTAYASLDNFSFEVSGPGISVDPDQFLAFTIVSGFLNNSTSDSTTTLGPDYSFSISNFVTNGVNTASGGATYALGNSNSLVYAQTNGDFASASTTVVNFAFDYLANTVVTLSADAFIDHQPTFVSEGRGVGHAAIDINSLSPYSSHAGLTRATVEPFSQGERISATFSAPIDTRLVLGFTAAVRINEFEQTSPVPEPQTYLMLLAGLGLIGLTKKNKKDQQKDVMMNDRS